jgi:hypothetical protein
MMGNFASLHPHIPYWPTIKPSKNCMPKVEWKAELLAMAPIMLRCLRAWRILVLRNICPKKSKRISLPPIAIRTAQPSTSGFYEKLNQRGFAIYPGKLTQGDCFRIGNIGRIGVSDVNALVAAIADVKADMGF